MAINLTFRSEKELEAFIIRVATPLAIKIAREQSYGLTKQRFEFRRKQDKANSKSAYEVPNQQGSGATVTGSRTVSGGQIAAFNSLLAQLSNAGLITDNST